MSTHADSQLTDAEAAAAMLTALASPHHKATLTLDQARLVGAREMLGRWTLQTPDGPLHRVAIVDVIDAESLGHDVCYRDGSDADTVWADFAEAYDAQQSD